MIKAKKITIIALLLAFFTLGITLFCIADKKNDYVKAETSLNGMDFSKSNGFQLEDALTGSPKTIEVCFKLNEKSLIGVNTKYRFGSILGNYCDKTNADANNLNIMIEEGKIPRFYYNKSSSGGLDWKVTSVSFTENVWYHMAFVRDTVNGKVILYVDGVKKAETSYAGGDIIPGGTCGNISIGKDNRTNGDRKVPFQGQIAYCAMSSQIKNQEQISASKNAMLSGNVNKELSTSVGDLMLLDFNTVHTYYTGATNLKQTPNTITATIKLNKNYAVGSSGVIVGNRYPKADLHSFNLEINAKGHLCVFWDAYKTEQLGPVVEFGNVDFRDGKKHHIAVVRDKNSRVFRLYDNGVFKESSSFSLGVGDDITGTYPIAIGNDLRAMGGERKTFKGYIYDVSLYSRALSSGEISTENSISDRSKITSKDYRGLLYNYAFTEQEAKLTYDSSLSRTVSDTSGMKNHLKLCSVQHYYEPSDSDWFTASDDEYTLIFMPDTQLTVSRDVQFAGYMAGPSTAGTGLTKGYYYNSISELDMTKTFQWIADNKDAMNLSFVMHMGDLKHSRGVTNASYEGQNDWREWQLISGLSTVNESFNTNGKTSYSFGSMTDFDLSSPWGFSILRNSGIPYTVLLGNHDYDDFYMYGGTGRTANYYNYYFSNDVYNSKFANNVVARYNPSNMMNVIYEFSSSTKNGTTIKYLVVALEFGPSDDMINWAKQIVSQEKYKNHRIIWNSHYLVYSDGTYATGDSGWNPDSYGYSQDAGIDTNRGGEIYTNLISQFQNSFMSAGGHVSIESVTSRTDKGVKGNDIYGLLFDMQDTFNNRGDSFLLVAKVNEKTKKITFRLYNPVLNKFYGVENEFEYDFSGFEVEEEDKTLENTGFVSSNMDVSSASVRFADDKYSTAVRFTTLIKKFDFDKVASISGAKFGMVLIPKYRLNGDLTVDTFGATNINITNYYMDEEINGVAYKKAVVVVYDIPQDHFGDAIAIRAFVNYNGKYIYSQTKSKSLTGVALDHVKQRPNDKALLSDYINLTVNKIIGKDTSYRYDVPYESGFLPSVSIIRGVSGKEIEGLVKYENGTLTYKVEYQVADVWDGSVATAFEGGTGTKNDPYLIATGAQLAYLASLSNAKTSGLFASGTYYKLTSNIDLNNLPWTPVCYHGGTGTSYNYFCGNFDGNGYTIANVYFNDTSKIGVGLFGSLQNATVTNLTVTGNITAKNRIGGLAYYSQASAINNVISCVNIKAVGGGTGDDKNIGGIIGAIDDNSSGEPTILTNCSYLGDITATGVKYVGGITGYSNLSRIEKCYNYSTLNCRVEAVGGIVGRIENEITTSGIYTISEIVNYGVIYGLYDSVGSVYGTRKGSNNKFNSCVNYGDIYGKNGGVDVNYSSSNIWDGSVATSYASGSGTSADPYIISTGAQLAYLAESTNASPSSTSGKYYKLGGNIDLNNLPWTPIAYHGGTGTSYIYFQGNFNGNGYVISNLYFNDGTKQGVGLFGSLYNATLTDFSVTGNITASNRVGGIAFYAQRKTTITKVNNYVNVTASNGNSATTDVKYVGGMIGVIQGAVVSGTYYVPVIKDCSNFGVISGGSYVTSVGGIAGNCLYSRIENCLNYGEIKGYSSDIGGIVGSTGSTTLSKSIYSRILSCTNYANVSSTVNVVGGIVGRIYATSSNQTELNGNDNYGKVSGEGGVGGIVGISQISENKAKITNCNTVADGDRNIVGTGNFVGGIVGHDGNSIITECNNRKAVEGAGAVGGIVGKATNKNQAFDNSTSITVDISSTITDCKNYANVTASGDYAGGIIGSANNAVLSGSNSNCTVKGSGKNSGKGFGGIVGWCAESTTVTNCKNKGGIVQGYSLVGGVAGCKGASATIDSASTNSSVVMSINSTTGVTVTTGTADNNYIGTLIGQSR